MIIEVQDDTAPEMRLSASPDILWPPNHKMLPVSLDVSASDNCDPEPIYWITSVTSNQPEEGLGDGDTALDWEITGDLAVNLRAERSGRGDGRAYTITVECVDVSGNSSSGTVTVIAPHDRGRKKK